MKIFKGLTMILAVAAALALSTPADAQRRHGGGHPGHFHGGHHGHFHHGGHVNFFFGGFGYPYYWGGPYYWGYPYGYYGYGYPAPAYPYYSYDPQGVYQGRLANPPRTTNDGGKDVSMAARVQRHLAETGYYDGEIDGIVGDGTRSAIRRYQRANGLPADGHIDGQLLQSMGLG